MIFAQLHMTCLDVSFEGVKVNPLPAEGFSFCMFHVFLVDQFYNRVGDK